MKKSELKFKETVQEILSHAGVKIDGDKPWDIQVLDDRFYQRLLAQGSLGLGESYMDHWWDCEKLDEFIYRITKVNIKDRMPRNLFLKDVLKAKLLNLQSKKRAFVVGKIHYDIGNDLYKNMLDKRMNYSCGYWKWSDNLDDAQESKLELICKKIDIKAGMKILDIGCGWGSFAKYAAEKYGVDVTGVTVSKEQVKLGNKLCQGLPVEIRYQDYRDITEKFDAIVSIGMFEHVGYKNYRVFMNKIDECLKDDGLFLLQTIGRIDTEKIQEPWINKYIFPNAITPTAVQISSACESIFIIEDWHNFGNEYDKTIMAWYKNFEKSWYKIKDDYDARFKRMWDFYLLSCAGGFRSRKSQLWQIVLSKRGVAGGYQSIR